MGSGSHQDLLDSDSGMSELSLRSLDSGVRAEHKENQQHNFSKKKKKQFKIRRKKMPNKLLKIYRSIGEVQEGQKSGENGVSFQTQTADINDPPNEKALPKLNFKVKAHVREQLQEQDKLHEQRKNKSTLAVHLQIERDLNSIKRNEKLSFEEEFEEITLMRKEKMIKLKRCVGVEALDNLRRQLIVEKREKMAERELLKEREEAISRTRKENDIGLPEYHQKIFNKQLLWEEETRDFFDQKNRLVQKFRESVTKIVIRIRAQKRLLALKRLIKENNIIVRDEMRQFVEKDWRMHEFSDFLKNSEKKLSYLLNENSVRGCAFPGQRRWKEKKVVTFDNEKPHLWFDNFANIEKIQFNDLEIMQYKDLDVFKLYNHPPVISALKEKSGAPQELAFKREIYPVHDLVKLRSFINGDDQISIEKEKSGGTPKNKKGKKDTHPRKKKTEAEEEKSRQIQLEGEIFDVEFKINLESASEENLYQYFDDFDEGVIETSIPEVLLDVFEQGAVPGQEAGKEALLEMLGQTHLTKNSVNLFQNSEDLKNYYCLADYQETDYERHLIHSHIDFNEALTFQGSCPLEDYTVYFISRMDGYKALKILLTHKIEQFYSFRKIYNHERTIFDQDNIAQYCPDIIYTIEKDDQLSAHDSDDENFEFFEDQSMVSDLAKVKRGRTDPSVNTTITENKKVNFISLNLPPLRPTSTLIGQDSWKPFMKSTISDKMPWKFVGGTLVKILKS